MRKHLELPTVSSSSYILNNRWISASIISIIIMAGMFFVMDIMIEHVDEPKDSPSSIKLSFIKFAVVPEPMGLPKEENVHHKDLPKKIEQIKHEDEQNKDRPKKTKQIIEEDEQHKDLPKKINKTIPEDKQYEDLPKNVEQPKTIIKTYNELSKGLNLTEPPYPKSAVKWGKEGTVEVEIHINRDGTINQVILLKTSGHKILDNQCIKTIKTRWKFSKQPYEIVTKRVFIFKLT